MSDQPIDNPLEKRRYHLHLVSDATGETVASVANAVTVQFEQAEAVRHVYAMVRTEKQLMKVMDAIAAQPGIVFCTMVNENLETVLVDRCAELRVPCVPVLDRTIKTLQHYLGAEVSHRPGRQHEMTEDYFKRIDALNYTMAHDDGQNAETLDEADVILVGVSRTSKTPTCIYLANRGIKAANIPIVPGIPLPEPLYAVRRPLVVGLTVNPERLSQIRVNRLKFLRQSKETDYTMIEKIKAEVVEAKRLFAKQSWPVIDVTKRSIEETAAAIGALYDRFLEERRHG